MWLENGLGKVSSGAWRAGNGFGFRFGWVKGAQRDAYWPFDPEMLRVHVK